jgi:thymidylate synthase (FAD)
MNKLSSEKISLYKGLGYCQVVDVLGTDMTPVKAARQSYRAELKGIEADTKLLHYLLKHGHTSPFEQASITWELRMPIFVMRQFVRHRTFRLNEESARYTEMRDDFYIPDSWRIQDTKNKQSSVEAIERSDGWHSLKTESVKGFCIDAFELYQNLIEGGVAREQARMVLPVNLMTAITVNIDLHNLIGFFKKRLAPSAQLEIQRLAQAMFYQFDQAFPIISKYVEENIVGDVKWMDECQLNE